MNPNLSAAEFELVEKPNNGALIQWKQWCFETMETMVLWDNGNSGAWCFETVEIMVL